MNKDIPKHIKELAEAAAKKGVTINVNNTDTTIHTGHVLGSITVDNSTDNSTNKHSPKTSSVYGMISKLVSTIIKWLMKPFT